MGKKVKCFRYIVGRYPQACVDGVLGKESETGILLLFGYSSGKKFRLHTSHGALIYWFPE